MQDLIERIQIADEGSPDLDLDISRALNLWWMPDSEVAGPWTQSLDAAIALGEQALPDWVWTVGKDDCADFYWASINERDTKGGRTLPAHTGDTPALALCVAILKAKSDDRT